MRSKYSPLFIVVSLGVVLCGLSLLAFQSASVEAQGERDEATASAEKFRGLCYGPHRDNEDPDFGIQPTFEELAEDFELIEHLTPAIRTYGATDNLELIPQLAQQHGIDVYPGAWISRFPCENERQIANLIDIANQNLSHVKGLIVGNEVLLRRDIPKDSLLAFIERVKAATDVPVTTAEIWHDWINHPDLAEAVDLLFVHIYPYWDGVAVEEGAEYVRQKWQEVKDRFPDKPIIIGETGWPSQGEVHRDAVPSEENQRRYLSDFIAMAENNDIDYFYFEIFDEKWKSKFEGKTGSNWGLYRTDGSLKPALTDLIPSAAQSGINRPPREVLPVETTLPLSVYVEACSPENSFFSSGWMGELADILNRDSTGTTTTDIIDEASTDNPYWGETSIRISYTPSLNEWGGICWQFPVNNWGVYPGYDPSGSIAETDTVEFSFWARGEHGGEIAEFITGGIHDDTLAYADSYGPISVGEVTLNQEWQEYSLSLLGKDLSMIIGGFCWVTNYDQNPNGATIFLDDMVFKFASSIKTSISDEDYAIPSEFFLDQNYPNPFNPSTTIGYQLKKNAEVDLSIYNVAGQKVLTLVHQNQVAGSYNVEWNGYGSNGKSAPSGVYIYHLTVNNTVIDSRKMILLK